MKPLTYVVGSLQQFNEWRCANRICNQALTTIRHIPDEQSTLGLMRPTVGHRVIQLPTADKEAVRRLDQRGFKVIKTTKPL